MFDLSKFSTRYHVRPMQEADADAILAFCLQNDQYYRYCGRLPTRELILHDLHITPPNTSSDAKYYVGSYDGETLVAILDLIDGYPDSDTAFIGFFMMNKRFQGRQIGTHIIRELCLYLKETGLKRILLGIDQENPQSNAFWAKNGFSVIRVVEQEEGTILLAEKCL